jgi:thiol-disulfide isomerase/thioredoxin
MQMSNKTFLVVFVLLLLLGGGLFSFINGRRNTETGNAMPTDLNSVVKEKNVNEIQTEPIDSLKEGGEIRYDDNQNFVGVYIQYNQRNFENNSDKKRVLFFHAPWCPYCRSADEDFKNNISMIPDDVVILKTDYDSELELKKKYGVTYQHTFVQVDEGGELVTKWNGGETEELLENIK